MESPPPFLLQAVQRETLNSKILWSARPDPWSYARSGWMGALFGILFTAFAVFWTWGASGQSSGKWPPSFAVLWGGMFIVIGLCILLSPGYAFWKALRTFYVVTERSAIIFEYAWSLRIHSFDVSSFGGFERVSRGERGGDILFERTIEHRGRGTHVKEVGFVGLRDYAEAERALKSMMERNKKAA